MTTNIVRKEVSIKDDAGKLRFDLVEPGFEEAVVSVLTVGAAKYSTGSWKHLEDGVDRYYAALRRHINAWRKGEKLDPETGLPHLAHAACNVMFLMYMEE